MTAARESEVFAGLQSVSSTRLDAVMDGFTDEQWNDLGQAFLDQIAMDVLGYLDVLDFDFNTDTDDALVILWLLYRRYNQRLPKHRQTTGGIR
jgi:hypothetical protein